MRRRHRSSRNWKLYLAIAVGCGVAATALHFLFAVPEQVQEYADKRVEEAVQKAVKEEARQAAAAAEAAR